MTADQPRDAAIAALDDLVERWHAWNATDDPDLKVMLGLGLMQDAFDALPNLAALAPADPTADPRAALAGHPSPDRGSGPWVLRLVCCGYDDGIERYATWDEADMFRQTYVTGPGGHDRAAILTRDLDTTYHRRRVARRLAALDAVEEPR